MTDPKTEAETRSAQIAAARAQWEFDLLRSSAPQSALPPARVNDDLGQDLIYAKLATYATLDETLPGFAQTVYSKARGRLLIWFDEQTAAHLAEYDRLTVQANRLLRKYQKSLESPVQLALEGVAVVATLALSTLSLAQSLWSNFRPVYKVSSVSLELPRAVFQEKLFRELDRLDGSATQLWVCRSVNVTLDAEDALLGEMGKLGSTLMELQKLTVPNTKFTPEQHALQKELDQALGALGEAVNKQDPITLLEMARLRELLLHTSPAPLLFFAEVLLSGAAVLQKGMNWARGENHLEGRIVYRYRLLERERVISELGLESGWTRHRVGLDFELEDVARALLDSGFDPALPTLFINEGTSMYLSEASNARTLAAVASLMQHPESRLWIDHVQSEMFTRRKQWPAVDRFLDSIERMGEPFIFGVPDAASWLENFGLKVTHDQDTGETFLDLPQDVVYPLYRFVIAQRAAELEEWADLLGVSTAEKTAPSSRARPNTHTPWRIPCAIPARAPHPPAPGPTGPRRAAVLRSSANFSFRNLIPRPRLPEPRAASPHRTL